MPAPIEADQARRPEVPAIEVELADGRRWGLALPRSLPCPVVHRGHDAHGRPVVRIIQTTRVGYPLEIRKLWLAIVLACGGPAGPGPIEAFFRMAVALLLQAHEIEPGRALALLDPTRVDLFQIAAAVLPACLGGLVDTSSLGER